MQISSPNPGHHALARFIVDLGNFTIGRVASVLEVLRDAFGDEASLRQAATRCLPSVQFREDVRALSLGELDALVQQATQEELSLVTKRFDAKDSSIAVASA